MDIIKFDLYELRDKKDGFSYYILGRSYDLEENGVSEDYEKAINYYYKGMEIGYPLCEYSIGISLVLGLGDVLDIDVSKGDLLLRDAYPKILEMCTSNDVREIEKVHAQFVLGAYNYFGLGDVPKNERRAFELISSCAKKGHLAAIYDLGANLYYNGVGTRKNRTKAKEYLTIAKDNGLKRAIEKYKEYEFDKSVRK